MMNTCATCKHWSTSDEFERGHWLGVRRCEKVVMFWDATEWCADGNGRKFLNKYNDTKAFVQDGSDYYAYLLTRPDFGCVSHIEKGSK